jgi:hypothetical protein
MNLIAAFLLTRMCVVIMRSHNGKSLSFVSGDIGTLATIHADQGTGWDALHAGWDTKHVNHSVRF